MTKAGCATPPACRAQPPENAVADDSFKDFVLDQLSALPGVRARAMFGAHGLYQADHFFAIVDEGRLFFKTDAASEADYTARGMGPFTYEAKGKRRTMSYHEVPPEILESAPELVAWARQAVRRAAATPQPGNRRPKAKRPSEDGL